MERLILSNYNVKANLDNRYKFGMIGYVVGCW